MNINPNTNKSNKNKSNEHEIIMNNMESYVEFTIELSLPFKFSD